MSDEQWKEELRKTIRICVIVVVTLVILTTTSLVMS